MDRTSLFFLGLMVIAGGFIAYFGDLIGRAIGKKRLKLGRMRPRHTAALFTGIAGALGSLLTIMVLFAVSKPVQTWILRGNQLEADLAKLEKQYSEAQSRIKLTDDELLKSNKDLDSTKITLKTTQGQVKDARAEALRIRTESAKLTRQVNSLKGEVANFRKRLAGAQNEQKSLLANIEQLKREASTLIGDREKLSKLNGELAQANDVLIRQQGALQRQLKELSDAGKDLQDQITELENDKSEAERKKLEAEFNLTGIKVQLRSAEIELSQAKESLQSATLAARMQPLAFSRGDELARLVVMPGLNDQQSRNYILGAIDMATETAKQMGSVPGSNSSDYVLLANVQGTTVNTTPEQQIAEAITKLRNQSDQTMIIVRALVNSFAGEPAFIRLETRPNKIIYNQNEVLGEIRIEQGMSSDDVINAIEKYVNSILRDKAVNDGLVPSVGTGRSLGEIPQENLLQTVQIVVEANRAIRIQFYAGSVTRAADVLSINLRVR